MDCLKSYQLVMGSILLSWGSYAWATAALPFGQTQTGTISSTAQTNSYTFNGNANDVIDFTLVATSGNLVPKIQLYSSAGKLIGSNYSGNPFGCSGSTLELNTIQLPATGSYTVDVSDCSSTNTGSYALYTQRTNDPAGAANLPFGQTQAGTISSAAQSSSYTFSANANDEIDFTLVSTGGSLVPKIRLYNPSGTLLSSNYSGNPFGCSGSTLELNTVSVPATGTYTVLIGDCADTNTGNYEVYLQRTDGPTLPMGLLFGQVQTGSIGSVSQSSTYTFSANANDEIDFTLITTSGSLVPKIRLYNPSGTLLSSNYSGNPFGCSGTTLELNTVSLPDTGTYTVLIGDCSDTNTGNFAIYTQRTNNPTGAANLPFAQAQTGLLGSVAGSNTYTFSANTNDVVDFTLVTTNGSLVPKIRLYNPAGTLLSSNYSGNPFGCSGTTLELNTVTLPSSGTYTVLIGDCSDTNTGNYIVYTQRTNNPVLPIVLFWGQVQTGTIGSTAQSGTYTFPGSASDVVNFTLVATSGSLVPKIRLYNPAGALVSSNYSGNPFGCSGSTVEMNSVTLPTSGNYTLLVGDCADTNTGNYSLSSQCFGACPAPAPGFTLNPTSANFAANASTGTVAVTASPATASWTAASNSSWIVITAGGSGTGNGTVSYSVTANNSVSPRNGSLTVAGITFPVAQAGAPPTFLLNPTSVSASSAAASGTVTITATPPDAPWTAASNASWITVVSGSSGTGSGSTGYNIAANTSASSRTGTITIAGQTFTVTQAACCAQGPQITSVSQITTSQYQTIVITGSGFGSLSPYTGDSGYIEVFDLTRGWAAGYVGPCYNGTTYYGGSCSDAVTLAVTSWSDSSIVLAGFSGSWGAGGWVLANGDGVEIAVWNAQSGSGPATTTTSVGSPSCSFNLTPASASLPATGTSTVETCPNNSGQPNCGVSPETPVAFTVTPAAACGAWTATSSNPGVLQVTSGASGNGAGTVSFALLNNAHNGAQSYTITVAGGGASATYSVTEAGSGDSQVYREVYALYEQFLGRDPDPSGFAFWTGTGGAGLGEMGDSFLTSPEAFNTDFAVMAAYQAATGGPPSYAQFAASLANLRAGAVTVTSLFNALAGSSFTATALYQNLLNRQPSASEISTANDAGLATWFEYLIGYQATATPIGSPNNEFQSTGAFHTTLATDHTNALYVQMIYYVTLGRDPDSSGFNFWLGVANTGGPGLLFQGSAGYGTRIQILGPGTPNQGFIGSPEFQGLFAN